MRWVYCAHWNTGDRFQESQSGGNGTSIYFEVTADAFLRGMVRRIVGNLVLVGLGKSSVQQFANVLESRSLACSAPPAPARGLSLWHVQYEDEGGLVSGPFDERRSR